VELRVSNLKVVTRSIWGKRGGWFRSLWSTLVQSLAILLAQAIFIGPLAPQDTSTGKSRQLPSTARLQDFRIVRPRFIVRGTQLSKVEIWISSTGTGLKGPALLGTATRISTGGRTETWTLPIPRDLLAVEIFAMAFGKDGKVVGKRSLPYHDPGALYEAMYGKK